MRFFNYCAIVSIIIAILFPTKLFAQEKVYDVVEKMPSFPNGVDAMNNYLLKNAIYPFNETAKLKGYVSVSFIVEKDGTISNANIIRGLSTLLDEEAKRVVLSMPKWTSGRQGGKAVRTNYTVRVPFDYITIAAKKGDTEAIEKRKAEELRKERDNQATMALGKLITGVIAAKTVLDGVSSDSGSSSTTSSSSSNDSSNDTEDTYSCTVHLKFSDGDTVYEGSGRAYFKGLLNTGSVKYYTDAKGNATIRWSKDKGKTIDTITLDRKIGFNEEYSKGGLSLEDGGDHIICLDCK